jgi:hypothetical protein
MGEMNGIFSMTILLKSLKLDIILDSFVIDMPWFVWVSIGRDLVLRDAKQSTVENITYHAKLRKYRQEIGTPLRLLHRLRWVTEGNTVRIDNRRHRLLIVVSRWLSHAVVLTFGFLVDAFYTLGHSSEL